MLAVDHLTAGYGPVIVLRDVTFTVPTGAVVLVAGPNGAGKTTLVHTIAGLLPARAGAIRYRGVPLHGRRPHRIARAGVALVPQGRRVFPSLTVAEHLTLAARPGAWTYARVLDTLPPLRPLLRRPARHLSGGEQQMLALARALVTNPSLLLLDEPTEGLAPSLAQTVSDLITTVSTEDMTVLVTAASGDPVFDPAPAPTGVTGHQAGAAGSRLSIKEYT